MTAWLAIAPLTRRCSGRFAFLIEATLLICVCVLSCDLWVLHVCGQSRYMFISLHKRCRYSCCCTCAVRPERKRNLSPLCSTHEVVLSKLLALTHTYCSEQRKEKWTAFSLAKRQCRGSSCCYIVVFQWKTLSEVCCRPLGLLLQCEWLKVNLREDLYDSTVKRAPFRAQQGPSFGTQGSLHINCQ